MAMSRYECVLSFSHALIGIEIIRMPYVESNISGTAKFGAVNSQFCKFLRLCSSKGLFVSQFLDFLLVLLRDKSYPNKNLLTPQEG